MPPPPPPPPPPQVAHTGETAKRRTRRVANERAKGDESEIFIRVILTADEIGDRNIPFARNDYSGPAL
jgi:hypothetical protein